MAYYIANLLLNVCILAIYTVMISSTHHSCLTRSGVNITDNFLFAFLIGFCVQLADFINSNILTVLYRSKQQSEESKFGTTSSFTRMMNSFTSYIELSLRLMNGLVIFFQFRVVHSKQGDYCAHHLGVLWLEARWLHAIIVLTIVKTIVFSCWQ